MKKIDPKDLSIIYLYKNYIFICKKRHICTSSNKYLYR